MRSSSSALLNRERLHLRLESRLLAKTKGLADRRGVTVTSLVEEGLRAVLAEDEALRKIETPLVDAEQI